MGGKIPSSYYMKNNAPVAKDYMETAKIMAGVGGRKKLMYNVDIAHSSLRYFQSAGSYSSYLGNVLTISFLLKQMGIYD